VSGVRNRSTRRRPADGCVARQVRVGAGSRLFLLVFALGLGGCANGDFGRLKQELVTDDMHGWVGREAARDAGLKPSNYPLTDEERQMRDLAYPLIEPPFDRNKFYSIVNEYGVSQTFGGWPQYDRTAYTKRLMFTAYRSATARYAQLNTDIRNDVERIPTFFAIARRVLDLDSKRDKSMAQVPDLKPLERSNAKARIAENTLIIEWVQQSLLDRAEAYRNTLERLVVATPAPMAVETERSLTLMQTRIAESQVLVGRAPGSAAPVGGPLVVK
jgi:hypothetical protein